MKRSIRLTVLVISLAPAAFIAALPDASADGAATQSDVRPIDFNRDIRPILSDKCFVCHGPDAPAKKIKLTRYFATVDSAKAQA
jgi:uncharacterized membrane protein